MKYVTQIYLLYTRIYARSIEIVYKDNDILCVDYVKNCVSIK